MAGNEAIPDLRTVCTRLGKVQYKWHNIGVALGVPEYKLKEFKDGTSPFSATIDYWLRGNCEGVPVSWETLVKALSSDYIAEIGLANEIQADYCPGYCSAEAQRNVPDGPSDENEQALPVKVCFDNAAEKPAHSEAEMKEYYKLSKPENLPDEGTDEFRKLEKFSKEVILILQTVNKNEYQAALTYMKTPTPPFSRAVIFPESSMVVGMFAKKKTALIRAKPGRRVGEFVEDAIKAYPNAQFVIGVGVCYSFYRQKHKLADVLVSETISDNVNKKFTACGEIENRGQTIDVVYELTKIFCMVEDEEIDIKVSDAGRKAKVFSGTFCCDPCLMNDEETRDKYLHANPRAIGGEMEGGELMQFDRNEKIKGIVVIKGVADYGDGTKAKDWQFSASMAALHYTEAKLCNIPSAKWCPTSDSVDGMEKKNGVPMVPRIVPDTEKKNRVPMVPRIVPDTDLEEPVGDYQRYVSQLPESAHKYLICQLDWKELLDWEEKLSDSNRDNHLLQRREVLKKWKDKMPFNATYGNLLKLLVDAGHADGIEAVMQVLRIKKN